MDINEALGGSMKQWTKSGKRTDWRMWKRRRSWSCCSWKDSHVERVVYRHGEICSFPSRKPPMMVHIRNIMALFSNNRSRISLIFLLFSWFSFRFWSTILPCLPMFKLASLLPCLHFCLPPVPLLQLVSFS